MALLLLSVLPNASAKGIEAFEQSYALCVRNIALNGLDNRFTAVHADLRASTPSPHERYDLITGAPPFMPLGSGILPSDPQRAAGRFELRGGVTDYFKKAADHLSQQGRAVILMDGAGEQRALRACEQAGLKPEEVLRVCPRPGTPATYAIITAARETDALRYSNLDIRDATGDAWSQEYAAVRAQLDLP